MEASCKPFGEPPAKIGHQRCLPFPGGGCLSTPATLSHWLGAWLRGKCEVGFESAAA